MRVVRGVLFGSVQWLPFSMDIALTVLPFLYYGAYIKENSYELPLSGAPIIWCGIFGGAHCLLNIPNGQVGHIWNLPVEDIRCFQFAI